MYVVFSARPSKLRAKLSIAGIWCVAGMLAAPMAVALRVAIVEEIDSSKNSTLPLLFHLTVKFWFEVGYLCYEKIA